MSPSNTKKSRGVVVDDRWSHLQDDLLELILQRLPVLDYIQFGSVCTSWRSAAIARRVPSTLHPPFLCRMPASFPLDGKRWRCFGTSEGWLIMASMSDPVTTAMCLLNPITHARIDLPSSSLYPMKVKERRGRHYRCPAWKAVLSSDPTSGSCIVLSSDPTSGSCIVVAKDWHGMVHKDQRLFHVFGLVEGGARWVHVKDLGDRILFVSHARSESCGFIQGSGLSRNSIYFKGWIDPPQVLLLSMEYGSFERTGNRGLQFDSAAEMTWFMPTSIQAREQRPLRPKEKLLF